MNYVKFIRLLMLILIIFALLSGCNKNNESNQTESQNTQSNQSNITPTVDNINEPSPTNYPVSNKEVQIGFELISYEIDSIPYTEVSFIINIEEEKEEILIGRYMGTGFVFETFENRTFFNPDSLVGCQVFYAGGGDNIFAYLENGKIIVKHNEFVLGNEELEGGITKEEVVITKDIPENSTFKIIELNNNENNQTEDE